MATPDHNEGFGGLAPAEPTGGAAAVDGHVRRGWAAWRRWRRSRPFWGGLLVVLAGAEILASEKAPLPLIIHIGLQGLAGYLIPAVMVLCGLLILFNPLQKTFYSILAILLALGSWITSNLGGFFIGMLLGVTGGALAFAWQRRDEAESPKRQWRMRRHGRHQREPSEGLALITGDPPPDPGGPPPDDGTLPPDDETRPLNAGPPAEDAGPTAGGAGPVPGNDRDGERGAGLGPWRNAAILAVPLMLAALITPALRGPAPATSPTPKPSTSPTTAPSPNISPSGTPAPSTSPEPRPSPTSTATPSPRPTRHRARHPRAAHPPAASAAAATSVLTAGSAVLTRVSFDGVATVPTAGGKAAMLKLSMDSLALSSGVRLLVRMGGNSYVTNDSVLGFSGNVVLYTTRISGDLNGTRVTYTPQRPPPPQRSGMTLTDVVADQLYMTAGSLQTGEYHITEGFSR